MGDRFRQLTDVGIFRDTLVPSLIVHGSLSVAAYGVGRYIDCVETKDEIWPAGFVINAWWAAVGRRVLLDGAPLSRAISQISRPEWLLLTGVTMWGGRLFYRITTRSVARGVDNPRYTEAKKEENFWNLALFKKYLPEALLSSIISLTFTAPFRHQGGVLTGYHPYVQALSVGLFGTGFALSVLADYQSDSHRKKNPNTLQTDGVWSIVRHPNYLGDALVHAAFPLLLFSSDMLAPLELLGPIANYAYLRYLSSDKELEDNQLQRYATEAPEKRAQLEEAQGKRNAFWPNLQEFSNKHTWIVLGFGAATMAIEQLLIDVLEY